MGTSSISTTRKASLKSVQPIRRKRAGLAERCGFVSFPVWHSGWAEPTDEASMKPILSSPDSFFVKRSFPPAVGANFPRQRCSKRSTTSSAFFRRRDCRHPKLRQSRRRKNAALFSGLHGLLGITTPAPLLDWRLRLAGRKPPEDGLRRTSIRVSDRPGPARLAEHLKVNALPSAPSKPGTGSPLLTGGLSARFSYGRPGPALDATLPSSPVFSRALLD